MRVSFIVSAILFPAIVPTFANAVPLPTLTKGCTFEATIDSAEESDAIAMGDVNCMSPSGLLTTKQDVAMQIQATNPTLAKSMVGTTISVSNSEVSKPEEMLGQYQMTASDNGYVAVQEATGNSAAVAANLPVNLANAVMVVSQPDAQSLVQEVRARGGGFHGGGGRHWHGGGRWHGGGYWRGGRWYGGGVGVVVPGYAYSSCAVDNYNCGYYNSSGVWIVRPGGAWRGGGAAWRGGGHWHGGGGRHWHGGGGRRVSGGHRGRR